MTTKQQFLARADRCLAERKFDMAERALKHVLSLEPNNVEALYKLAAVFFETGRSEESIDVVKKTLQVAPRAPFLHATLVDLLRKSGDPDAAVRHGTAAVVEGVRGADLFSNLGVAYVELGDDEKALQAFDSAIALSPLHADAIANRGDLLFKQQQHLAAELEYRRASAIVPSRAELFERLATVMRSQGRPKDAVVALEQAVRLAPNVPSPHIRLGNVLRELGRLQEATQSFERALKIDPKVAGAYFNLAHARTFRSLSDPHVAAMEALLSDRDRLPKGEQAHILFAMGKVYDDVGEYDKAFPLWLEANAIVRSEFEYDQGHDRAAFERLEKVVTSDFVRAREGVGVASKLPIFILGMPRSGTTLVEQILASHPDVTAGGELHDFGRAVNGVAADLLERLARPDLGYPEFFREFNNADFAAVGQAYVDSVSERWPNAVRLTDKMPGNYMHLGIIHLALPGAKIIHTKRNPIDVCISCFSKLFAGRLDYAYDLRELGRAYTSYDRLMNHWRQVLPAGAFLEVSYDELVADSETQMRRLLEFCGLDWNPNVTQYYKTDRPVRTASAAQVRQPIYRSSLERWRHYEGFLGPLIDELAGAGVLSRDHT